MTLYRLAIRHTRCCSLIFGSLLALPTGLWATPTPGGFDVGVQHLVGNTLAENQTQGANLASGGVSFSTCVLTTTARTACGGGTAAIGRLGIQSSFSVPDPTVIAAGNAESANANANFRDVLTLVGFGSGTYTLTPTFRVDGTATWDRAAFLQSVGFALSEFSPTDGTTRIFTYNSIDSVNQNTYSMTHVLGPITIQGGVAFNFAIGFDVASRIFSGPASTRNTLVTANFMNTMLLTGLELRDSTNTVVAFNSSNFQTTSGASYAPNGVAPEPGSSMLLLAGLVVLGTARFALRLN